MKLRIFLVIFITLLAILPAFAIKPYSYQFKVNKQTVVVSTEKCFTIKVGNKTFHPAESTQCVAGKITLSRLTNDGVKIELDNRSIFIYTRDSKFAVKEKSRKFFTFGRNYWAHFKYFTTKSHGYMVRQMVNDNKVPKLFLEVVRTFREVKK